MSLCLFVSVSVFGSGFVSAIVVVLFVPAFGFAFLVASSSASAFASASPSAPALASSSQRLSPKIGFSLCSRSGLGDAYAEEKNGGHVRLPGAAMQ